MIREYKTIREISGPLMVVDHVQGVTYDELAEIVLSDGSTRRCKVLEVNGDRAVVQLFGASAGINLADSRIRFLGHPLQLGAGGGVGDVQVLRAGADDQDELLPEVVEDHHLLKQHQVHILKALLVLGVQHQRGLGVFYVIIREVAHQSAGKGRQAGRARAFVGGEQLPQGLAGMGAAPA